MLGRRVVYIGIGGYILGLGYRYIILNISGECQKWEKVSYLEIPLCIYPEF